MRKTVHVKDQLIFYRKFGRGKALIILHGWGLSGRLYLPVGKILAKKFRVFLPDLPGFGHSPLPAMVWSVPDYARLVVEFAKKMKLNQFILVGHSFGARVAVQVAVDYPGRVEKLILSGYPILRRAHSARQVLYVLARGGRLIIPRRYRRAVRSGLYRLIGAGDYVREPEGRRETFLRVISWDQRRLIGKVGCRTALLWGENDRLTPLKHAYFVQKKIPGAKLGIVPDVGHRLPFQLPETFARLTEEFSES